MVSRLKVAVLAVTASTGVFALGGCLSLGSLPMERLIQNTVIALLI